MAYSGLQNYYFFLEKMALPFKTIFIQHTSTGKVKLQLLINPDLTIKRQNGPFV